MAKADADRDRSERDATASLTLAADVAAAQLSEATQAANNAHEQLASELAAAAADGNAGAYRPWHAATTAGSSVVKHTDFPRPALTAPNVASPDSYFYSSVASMFGLYYTGTPQLGYYSPTAAEHTALTGRVSDQAWIIDHGQYASPVTAGIEEATPQDFWETASAVVTPVANAGLAYIQSQFAWAGFAGMLGDTALQVLQSGCGNLDVVRPDEPPVSLGNRSEYQRFDAPRIEREGVVGEVPDWVQMGGCGTNIADAKSRFAVGLYGS